MLLKKINKDDEIISTYDSSNILASKLNIKTNDLTIIFKQGKQYLYENVGTTDYMRFETAESQGKVFNSHIKQYPNKQLAQINPSDIEQEINLVKNQEQLLLIENKRQQLIHHMETMIIIAKSAKLSPEGLDKLIKLSTEYKQLTHPVQ